MDSDNKQKHDYTTEHSTKKPTLPPIQQLTNGQVFDHRILSSEGQLNSSTSKGVPLEGVSPTANFLDRQQQLQQQQQQQQQPHHQQISHQPIHPVHQIPASLPNHLHSSHSSRFLPIREQQQSSPEKQKQQQDQHPNNIIPQQDNQHPTSPPSPSASNTSKPKLVKKYFCKICSQGFTRKHNMVSHELIHSSLKPHVCKVCNLRFRRIHDLKRHEKLHTGEKPYACSKCSRRFARPDALTRHQNSANACTGLSGSATRTINEGENDIRRDSVEHNVTPVMTANTMRATTNEAYLMKRDSSFSHVNDNVAMENNRRSSTATEAINLNSPISASRDMNDENLSSRPPLMANSVSLPHQHFQTGQGASPLYHNQNSRLPLQHSHSTPAAPIPIPTQYLHQNQPPHPGQSQSQGQQSPHQQHGQQLPLGSQLYPFQQHAHHPNQGSSTAGPSSQYRQPHQQVPPLPYPSQAYIPYNSAHIPPPQQHLIGGGGGGPHIQGSGQVPPFPYMPHTSYPPQGSLHLGIPKFQPHQGTPVQQSLQPIHQSTPISSTTDNASNAPTGVLSTAAPSVSQPPHGHQSAHIASVNTISSSQSADQQQRGDGAFGIRNSPADAPHGPYRPYPIQSGGQHDFPPPQFGQGAIQPQQTTRPPQKSPRQQPLKPYPGNISQGNSPRSTVPVDGYFDTGSNQPSQLQTNHGQSPTSVLIPSQQQIGASPTQRGGPMKDTGGATTKEGEQNQGTTVREAAQGQYIPYARYQELYNYTQSIQDSLTQLNNRLNNLEKKEEEKEKPK